MLGPLFESMEAADLRVWVNYLIVIITTPSSLALSASPERQDFGFFYCLSFIVWHVCV